MFLETAEESEFSQKVSLFSGTDLPVALLLCPFLQQVGISSPGVQELQRDSVLDFGNLTPGKLVLSRELLVYPVLVARARLMGEPRNPRWDRARVAEAPVPRGQDLQGC